MVEMGMSAQNEIKDLCYAAKPMMGIITNIGVSHIEHLGSRENILKAKLELADALPDGATLLLCDDNDLLHTVDIPRLHVVRYGLNSPRAEIKATIVSATPLSTNFMLHAEGQSWRATIPGTGEHLVLNALAAFGAGRAMGIPAETAIEALKNYTPSGQRQKVVEHEGITMVEDCYNASPDSMRAAIKTLGRFPCDGRRIFVAADMLELGDIAEESHREIGALCAQEGIDLLLTWGPLAQYATRAAKAAGMEAHHFEEKEALTKYLAAAHLVGRTITLIPGWLQLHYITNDGMALSLLRGARWLFVVMTAVYLAVVIYVLVKKWFKKTPELWCIAAITGGAIGNFIDRISTGLVIDMICIPWFSTFNVADLFITFGALILVVYILTKDKELLADKPKEQKKPHDADA